ncbi:MAG: hypothetical protein JW776_16280 [Candidatus Lokiarchaeota archaeon]|nr:hypothetical protein [Candidatus Lokiarchaeota archaeon]
MSFKPDELNRINTLYPELCNADGQINLENEHAKNLLSDWKEPKAFDKIGYARPLGGFFYEFFYYILGTVISLAIYPFILSFMYPWPESQSYANLVGVIFLIFENIFNIPTQFAIDRFVGEYRVKNTRKMIDFIRFYTWWQMMSGVFIVTGFSYYVFQIINSDSTLVWAKWLMLITISREYPALQDFYINCIRGMQKYDLEAKLNFINQFIVSAVFEFGFVMFGKYIIGRNPIYGPLVGISIGFAIGTYLDDFVSIFINMFYFSKIIRPLGYTLKDCFIPQVEKDTILKSIKFGIVVSIPGLIKALFSGITAFWWYSALPAYLTLITLSEFADGITNYIKIGGGINIRPTISEAYNSGQKNLTSYYISMSWKFIMFFLFALGTIVIVFLPSLLSVLLQVAGAEEYVLAVFFIIPNFIATIIEQPVVTAEDTILGANKPLFNSAIMIVSYFVEVLLIFLSINVFRIHEIWGLRGIFWLLPLIPFIPNLIRMITSWIYIDKKIARVHIKKFGWQSFIAPIIPAIIIGGIGFLWTHLVFPFLSDLTNSPLIAGVITLIFAIVGCMLFIYFPLYALFGGWDEHTLSVFQEATEISGPSRIFFGPIFKISNWFVKKSPFHNRFPIPYKKAQEEAFELMKIRHIKDKLVMQIYPQN